MRRYAILGPFLTAVSCSATPNVTPSSAERISALSQALSTMPLATKTAVAKAIGPLSLPALSAFLADAGAAYGIQTQRLPLPALSGRYATVTDFQAAVSLAQLSASDFAAGVRFLNGEGYVPAAVANAVSLQVVTAAVYSLFAGAQRSALPRLGLDSDVQICEDLADAVQNFLLNPQYKNDILWGGGAQTKFNTWHGVAPTQPQQGPRSGLAAHPESAQGGAVGTIYATTQGGASVRIVGQTKHTISDLPDCAKDVEATATDFLSSMKDGITEDVIATAQTALTWQNRRLQMRFEQ